MKEEDRRLLLATLSKVEKALPVIKRMIEEEKEPLGLDVWTRRYPNPNTGDPSLDSIVREIDIGISWAGFYFLGIRE